MITDDNFNDKYTHQFHKCLHEKTTTKIQIDLVIEEIFSQMCPSKKR